MKYTGRMTDVGFFSRKREINYNSSFPSTVKFSGDLLGRSPLNLNGFQSKRPKSPDILSV